MSSSSDETYGVYSRHVNTDVESLYYVSDNMADAWVFLGKYVSYTAYGSIPLEQFLVLIATLDELSEQEKLDNEIVVHSLAFSVRKIVDNSIELP